MRKKKKGTGLRTAIKWTLILAGTAALYGLGKEAAFRERGVSAVDGEAAILFTPILYYAVERIVKDLIVGIWKLKSIQEGHTVKTYFRRCKHCGTRLDPGELCDCQMQKIKQVAEEPVIRQSLNAHDQFGRIVDTLLSGYAERG